MNKHTIVSFIAFSLVAVVLPSTAFAYTQTNDITTALQNLLNFITGSVAKSISVMAIVAIGYLTLARGVIPKEKGIGTCIGIAIILAAQSLYTMFGGGI